MSDEESNAYDLVHVLNQEAFHEDDDGHSCPLFVYSTDGNTEGIELYDGPLWDDQNCRSYDDDDNPIPLRRQVLTALDMHIAALQRMRARLK